MPFLEEIIKQLKDVIEEKNNDVAEREQNLNEQKAYLAGLSDALAILQGGTIQSYDQQEKQKQMFALSKDKIIYPPVPEEVKLTNEGTMIIGR